eukprot:SAG11_NODE_3207_length_2610_cov_2.529271_1_plen_99_part_00
MQPKQVFAQFDLNGDGEISFEEFKVVVTRQSVHDTGDDRNGSRLTVRNPLDLSVSPASLIRDSASDASPNTEYSGSKITVLSTRCRRPTGLIQNSYYC